MKRIIIWLGLLVLFGQVVQAQDYNFPEGQNDTGTTIDSIIINGDTLSSFSNNYVHISPDTLSNDDENGGFSMELIRSDNDGPAVYYRIAIDLNENGTIEMEEVLQESGAITAKQYTIAIEASDLANYMFGVTKNIVVEMASTPSLFGATTLPQGSVYKKIITPIITSGGKRLAVRNSSQKFIIDNTDCAYCVGDTLQLALTNEDNCAVIIESIQEITMAQGNLKCQITTPTTIFYDDAGNILQPNFTLNSNEVAYIDIIYDDCLPGDLKINGNSVFIDVAFKLGGTCSWGNQFTIQPHPYLGCSEATDILYTNHSTQPVGTEKLPWFTGTYGTASITATTDVVINQNDAVAFRAERNGFILAKKNSSSNKLGVLVEKDACFHAYKAPAQCAANVSMVQDNPAAEERHLGAVAEPNTAFLAPVASAENSIQVYPNPFNNRFNISCVLSRKEVVTIEIFDLLGRKKTSLLQGELLSQGQHQFDVSAADFEEGIYFSKITIGEIQYTQKLIKSK